MTETPWDELPAAPRFACPGQGDGDERHDTIPVYRRCPRCRHFALAGFECDTCGYEDVDRPGRLPGHGVGRCELER